MSTVIIPTRNDGTAFYEMRVDLTGVEFIFAFKWSGRESCWYFTLSDAVGVPIASGVKVVLGVPLLRRIVDVRRPAGDIIAIDTTGEGVEAGLTDLGARVLLAYGDGA